MKKIVCAVLLSTLLAVPGNAQELQGSSGQFKASFKHEFDVGSGGTLEIDKVAADIQVSGWDQDNVEIHHDLTIRSFTKAEAKEIYRRAENSVAKRGKTIHIEGDYNGNRVHSIFRINVPEKFNLEIHNSGGDISLSDVIGEIQSETSGGDIDIENTAGRTNLNTSGGDISVVNVSGDVSGSTSGGDIKLEDILGRAHFRTSGGDITLDHATNDISLKTSGGDVTAKRVEGRLGANTSGGDIVVYDCIGECSVNTSGGDVRLEGIKSKIHAATSGGDITGSDFDARVSARTSGGDIHFTDVRAGVDAQTSGGKVDVEITLKDFSKDHAVELGSTGGTIRLTLPEKLPATIEAQIRTSRHDYQTERYDIYSDFPLTKSEPEKFGDVVIKSTGDINGGGDPIRLETTSGDIYIKKK